MNRNEKEKNPIYVYHVAVQIQNVNLWGKVLHYSWKEIEIHIMHESENGKLYILFNHMSSHLSRQIL